DQCYDNLRVSRNAWDTNLVKVNPKHISVNWETSGGGAFAVIPLKETGKLPDRIPLFRGHTAVVLDTDWNPFNDDLIASGSDDGKIFLWRVPDDFTCRVPVDDPEEIKDIAPVGKLQAHPRKVGHVLFNPSAENVLASASGDYTIKIWDVEAGAPKLTLNIGDITQSLSWSADGSMLVTTSRDKKLRIWDPRQQEAVVTTPGHSGAKNSRSIWLGTKDRIVTTGFSRMSDRQYALWDIKAPKEPIGGFKTLDSISGVCMPFWDDGTQCLYLAGKGDGNIRYFEYSSDKFEYLAEYQSADPQRGIGFLPKRGVNMHENEVVRAFKTVNDNYIEPISFIVPRRSDQFQDDIFPPTTGLNAAMGANDWFGGKDGVPPLIDMASLFEGQGLKEIAGADVKVHTLVEVDQQKKPEPPKPSSPGITQKAVQSAEPLEPKEVKKQVADQKQAMSAMADKFADKKGEQEKEEDPSAFDEPENRSPVKQPQPPQPQRTPTIVISEGKEQQKQAEWTVAVPAAGTAEAAAPAAVRAAKWQPAKVATPSSRSSAGTPTTSAPASPVASGTIDPIGNETINGIQEDLKTIKDMLLVQQKTIDRQTSIIEKLVREVEELKVREVPAVVVENTASSAMVEDGEGPKVASGSKKPVPLEQTSNRTKKEEGEVAEEQVKVVAESDVD
ncbi:Coronin-like protein crn1, partial [Ascosphaera aggregata]